MPQSVKDSRELNDNEKKFVGKVERDNYSALTLDELAIEYESVERQAQLLQGKILLEARNRFLSDKEFGQWCATHSICVGSQQQRNRLINLARFFDGRELDKIGISAAYEISAPSNADIAEEIYETVRGKDMSVAEVKREIAKRKGENPVRIIPTDKPLDDDEIIEKAVEIIEESVKTETAKIETDLESQIMAIVECENPQIAIVALKNVIDKINAKRYGK